MLQIEMANRPKFEKANSLIEFCNKNGHLRHSYNWRTPNTSSSPVVDKVESESEQESIMGHSNDNAQQQYPSRICLEYFAEYLERYPKRSRSNSIDESYSKRSRSRTSSSCSTQHPSKKRKKHSHRRTKMVRNKSERHRRKHYYSSSSEESNSPDFNVNIRSKVCHDRLNECGITNVPLWDRLGLHLNTEHVIDIVKPEHLNNDININNLKDQSSHQSTVKQFISFGNCHSKTTPYQNQYPRCSDLFIDRYRNPDPELYICKEIRSPVNSVPLDNSRIPTEPYFKHSPSPDLRIKNLDQDSNIELENKMYYQNTTIKLEDNQSFESPYKLDTLIDIKQEYNRNMSYSSPSTVVAKLRIKEEHVYSELEQLIVNNEDLFPEVGQFNIKSEDLFPKVEKFNIKNEDLFPDVGQLNIKNEIFSPKWGN